MTIAELEAERRRRWPVVDTSAATVALRERAGHDPGGLELDHEAPRSREDKR